MKEEDKVREKISKATLLLIANGIYKTDKNGITSVIPIQNQYAYLIPNNLLNRLDILGDIDLKLDYDSLIKEVINNDFNTDKVSKKICEMVIIELEKQKIAERKYHLELRHKAEKEYFGKEKTKRESINNNFKESIFDKFNNECAICGVKEGLHIHHKDENSSNNQINNLIVLCGVCHKKVHMKVR